VLEPGKDGVGREQLHPGRGELDRERHPMEPGADAGDSRRIVVGHGEVGPHGDRAGDEEPDRLVLGDRVRRQVPLARREVELLEIRECEEVAGHRQAGYRVLLLARHVERGPARDDDRQPFPGPEEVGHDRTGIDDLLEVVEDEEGVSAGDPLGQEIPRAPRGCLDQTERPGDPRGDERGVADRLERDEPESVLEAVGRRRGQLERQAGLAGAARAGERQQPRRREQPTRFGKLSLAPDEARQLGRQVVGPAIEGPDRWKVGRQAVDDELADPLGPEVLQPVLAEAPNRHPVRQLVRDERRRGLGNEDLAAMTGGPDPRRPMDVRADVLAVRVEPAVAGVDSHSDAHRRIVRPGLGGECHLGGSRRGDGLRRPAEDGEEGVAFRLLFVAVGLRDRCPDQLPMAGQDRGPAIVAQVLGEPRGSFDVREQERHGPDRLRPRHHRDGIVRDAVAP
jgi:hypothetical protein